MSIVAAVIPSPFHGILSSGRNGTLSYPSEAPPFFHDLNLDQVVGTITASWGEYDLGPFFLAPLRDLEEIAYRQAVFRDLENEATRNAIASFSRRMRTMREHRAHADACYHKYEKARWLLDAVQTYCEAVECLDGDLRALDLRSQGMQTFRGYLRKYCESPSFERLSADARSLHSDLSAIRYCLLIQGNSVTVRRLNDEADYSAMVATTFAKFRYGAARDYRIQFASRASMNHIDAALLDRVALLNPEIFGALESYCVRNGQYQDESVARFDREIQFYGAYLAYADRFRRSGLGFCYPQMSDTSKEVHARSAFDAALASKLIDEKANVVCNDFALQRAERILVVSGPNHGGKTTFARMFGQLHYLACLGCPVPGTEARLFLFDQLFTHFEREEDIETLRGKLQDDLVRIHRIFDLATPSSVLVMNEIFSSTTLQDAVYLGSKIMAMISELDLLCVCVTFLTELASFDDKTVSIVATVDPQNPVVRTFRLERRLADGLAYALAIAEKHGVTYEGLKARIAA